MLHECKLLFLKSHVPQKDTYQKFLFDYCIHTCSSQLREFVVIITKKFHELRKYKLLFKNYEFEVFFPPPPPPPPPGCQLVQYQYLVCRGANLCDVVMGNKQEPVKSLWFHHGARHCVNVQSEVRKVLAFALDLVLNRVPSKTKGEFVSVGFITNWNFEMLAAMLLSLCLALLYGLCKFCVHT